MFQTSKLNDVKFFYECFTSQQSTTNWHCETLCVLFYCTLWLFNLYIYDHLIWLLMAVISKLLALNKHLALIMPHLNEDKTVFCQVHLDQNIIRLSSKSIITNRLQMSVGDTVQLQAMCMLTFPNVINISNKQGCKDAVVLQEIIVGLRLFYVFRMWPFPSLLVFSLCSSNICI